MQAKVVSDVEEKCRYNSFEKSTETSKEFRKALKTYPSLVIQSRIEFDSICQMDLQTCTPLQLQRVSSLKRELINILHTDN